MVLVVCARLEMKSVVEGRDGITLLYYSVVVRTTLCMYAALTFEHSFCLTFFFPSFLFPTYLCFLYFHVRTLSADNPWLTAPG